MVTALSGALLTLDPPTACLMPTRDELEHDDLKIKDAAARQQKAAKDTIDFLHRMHRFAKHCDVETRKCTLAALHPLLLKEWPETLSVFCEALNDESEHLQACVAN